ncbi:regulator of nonsense transcripts UPF2-like [Magnolia sinica]|uniref:regulator of nonsense transcripts UPF2-like n=1 Tax=Magnolia sinica TaxID=86752 RepID=UPI00265B70C8|nr:regulator of nonsense transcripts UPF2-like [Magnolia sinica]
MYIPRDCSLVQSTKQKEAAELEEKQNIKRLNLEYNDREEEEFNGSGTQPMNWMQAGAGRPAHGTDPGGVAACGSGTTHLADCMADESRGMSVSGKT